MAIQIEQGILLPMTLTPVGQGVTGAQYALVNIGGVSQRCVVKQVGHREIAAECLCALLGDHFSLPTLVPVVITDPRDQSFWFGARNVGYPSLSTRLGLTNSTTPAQLAALAQILSSWTQVSATISFDELIANGDRNPGNVLWNGIVFTIIDHERALDIQPMLLNKLGLFATQHLPAQQVASIQNGIVGAALAQQALLSAGTGVWDAIEAEFLMLPQVIVQHCSVFRRFAQGRTSSLVSKAGTSVAPLMNAGVRV